MNFIRHVGSDLDAFVDDGSLMVSAAVPEPADILMLGIGAVAVIGGWGLRRRNAALVLD
jgi:hypothetical protein